MSELKKSRSEKMVSEILDSGFDELTKVGIEAGRALIQEVKAWGIKKYQEIKSKPDANAKAKLENLQRYIDMSNSFIEIGMEKKEIDFMWAMKKLGYSKEEIEKIVEAANMIHSDEG